ncbi:MAG: hypothetical protein ABSC56_10870 [Solirubrobacteraceae bacterium]|jgi:hypothetical protein
MPGFARFATALLLALAGTTGSATATNVPVVRCPTLSGIKAPPVPLPRTVSASASARALRGLDAYSSGALLVLAPHGWHCHAITGADGSASITVAAGATSSPTQPALTAFFADTTGTSASLACSLFAGAQRQLPAGVSCPRRSPRRETRSAAGAGAVYFTDPPRVRGNGTPSGGSDAAHGVAAFVPASKDLDGYAFLATCTLPADERARCATILADALTRVPGSQ